MIGSEINHKLNADWAIHHRFLYTHGDSVNTFVNPAPAFNAAQAFNEATGIMQRNIFQQRSEQEVYSTNLDVTGKLDIAGTRHDLLVGVDYYRSHNLYGSDGQWVAPNPALAIDIFNPGPSYGIARSVFDAALKTSSTALPRSDIYNQWHGVCAGSGDHRQKAAPDAGWPLRLGGNRPRARHHLLCGDRRPVQLHSVVIRKDQGFSPRLGVLYEFTPQLSAYGTWTTSFGANNAPAANGRTFDPQVGEQYELGLKAQLFESRLLGTLAAYKLTKDNILVADLNTADPNDRIANKQGSQGIELDLTGRVSRYLSLIASYAYTETKVIEDHAAGSPTKGNRLANVPKHSGSMSVRYDLNGQGAKGLSMGMGAFVAGKREVDLANTAHCWAMCVWMPSWPTAAGSLAARGPRPSSTCATCSIPSTTNRPTRTPTSRRAWGSIPARR
jgi:iron complex outermembrane receptor protein